MRRLASRVESSEVEAARFFVGEGRDGDGTGCAKALARRESGDELLQAGRLVESVQVPNEKVRPVVRRRGVAGVLDPETDEVGLVRRSLDELPG